ncbi:MAG: hypothetical protein R3258_07710 [Acidimicrobiia bacterium]|nr:hypothetical protein [Acidimicrobiia bacterium]
MAHLVLASNTAWVVGFGVGLGIVVAVVALVVPILLLARRIWKQAEAVNAGLQAAVVNTAALAQLETTIESAEAIIDGLRRGRTRLGG